VVPDPLANAGGVIDVPSYVNYARFCELTAHMISDHADGIDPDPEYTQNYFVIDAGTPFQAEVVVAGGGAVTGATVKLYRGQNSPSDVTVNTLHRTDTTDAAGLADFAWPASDAAVLLEVTKPEFSTEKRWLALHDLKAGAFLPNGGTSGSFSLPDMKLRIELFHFTPTDNNDSALGWNSATDATYYGGDYLRYNSGQHNPETFYHPLPSDSEKRGYRVMATWKVQSGNHNAVPHTVRDKNNNTLATFYANQTQAPNSYQDATGVWWKELGVIDNPPAPYMYTYVTAVSGAIADGMRIIEAE
jgi:hypothetical protein